MVEKEDIFLSVKIKWEDFFEFGKASKKYIQYIFGGHMCK